MSKLGLKSVTIDRDRLPGGKRRRNTSFVPRCALKLIQLVREFYYFLIIHVLAVKWVLVELLSKHRPVSMQFYEKEAKGKNPAVRETFVITGGTGGIGKEVVRKLLILGKNVVLGCQDPGEGRKLIRQLRTDIKTGTIECIQLELLSLESVRHFAQKVFAKNKRIHCLINNAGIMLHPYAISPDGFESHLQINYLSHFLLIQLMLPRMVGYNEDDELANTQMTGRIINVSSCVHHGGTIDFKDLNCRNFYSPHRAYMDTKLMLVTMSNYLNTLLVERGSLIRSIALHPAVVDTALYDHARFYRLFRPFTRMFCKNPDQASDGIIYAALSPALRGIGGIFLANSKKWKPHADSLDKNIQERLYNLTCKMVDLRRAGEVPP